MRDTKPKSMAGAVLHWDYENAPVPRGASVLYVLGEMRKAIHDRFGVLLDAYVYADTQKVTPSRRQELAMCGLDIIDCSRDAGKANTVDFRIIARSLAELARPLPVGAKRSAVVVVTGDGDYAYTLSKLGNLEVDTMLVFDDDRPEIVHVNMLQVAKYTVAISFGGREHSDDSDVVSSEMGEAEEGVPLQVPTGPSGGGGGGGGAGAGTGPPPHLTHMQQVFLLAISRAPQADDEGFRSGTEVGGLFHKLRTATEPTKSQRNAVYRSTCTQLTALGHVECKPEPFGSNLLRAVRTPAPDE